jgi:UDP-N-acetylmuramoylalanine--D-glutamate ligase
MNLEKFEKIAILGFWLEGKSSLKFLIKSWVNLENITILDWDEDLKILEKANKVLWKKYLDNLWDFDLIFKSPWISPYNEKIINFREKLISNAEIFFDNYKWKIIWITATKWKSTTSTLLYKTLEKAWYKVKLVWNIWNPIFDEIDIFSWESYDFIVYELSSYMLETLKPKLFVWILWNIYPCHIDWHNESMDVYAKAKTNLLENSENIIINENFTEYLWENLKEKNINTFW